jgi:V/A-type H+-transporting ATPase subunit C
MADNSYIYADARIHVHESTMLNAAFMEQLLSAPDEAACLKLLQEHGWGAPGMAAEAMLEGETAKTWELIAELVPDLSVFDVFRYESDYHNLKAAVKEACTAGKHPGIYLHDGTVEPEKLEESLTARDFDALPEEMREPARHALDTLLQTRDGQLCDCIVDRAALTAIRSAGERSGSELLALYGEITAAVGDLKIAVRALATGKERDFMELSLAPCATLDAGRLADAATDSMESLAAYLSSTRYAGAAEELKKSSTALECWCDNVMMRAIRPQIHNPFGLGPLAAFILARENEIRTVRMILAGKRNKLSADSIRERVRETYV